MTSSCSTNNHRLSPAGAVLTSRNRNINKDKEKEFGRLLQRSRCSLSLTHIHTAKRQDGDRKHVPRHYYYELCSRRLCLCVLFMALLSVFRLEMQEKNIKNVGWVVGALHTVRGGYYL